MIKEDQKTSFSWKYLQMANLQTVDLVPKESIDPSYPTYTLICLGGRSPIPNFGEIPSISASIYYNTNLIASSSQIALYSSDFKQQLTIKQVTLTKEFNFQGIEADYNFIIQSNYNMTMDSMIYVVFPKNISASLNRGGNFECYINSKLSLCQVANESTVQIYFPTLVSSQFTLKIAGVEQVVLGPDTRIWIGIDNDTNSSNGLLEDYELQDNETIPSNPTPILVTSLEASESNQLSITLNIYFSLTTVILSQQSYLIVQLSPHF